MFTDFKNSFSSRLSSKLVNKLLLKIPLQLKPGIERLQALTDISRSVLCCHSNETHVPIANVPNSVQLEGAPYHSLNLHLGLCSSVGMWRGTDRQTHRRIWPIYLSPRLCLTWNVVCSYPIFDLSLITVPVSDCCYFFWHYYVTR